MSSDVPEPQNRLGLLKRLKANLAFVVIAVVGGCFIAYQIAVFVRIRMFPPEASRMECAVTLRNIGERLQQYASRHDNRFPWMVSTNEGGGLEYVDDPSNAFRHFLSLSNEIPHPSLLLCREDERKPASAWESFSNANLSYFIGTGSKPDFPDSVVAGDRNIAWKTNDFGRVLWWDDVPGLHGAVGNLLLSGGRVLSNVDSNQLNEIFALPENRNNMIVQPQ